MSKVKKISILTATLLLVAVVSNILMHATEVKDEMAPINALWVLFITMLAWVFAVGVLVAGLALVSLYIGIISSSSIVYEFISERKLVYRFYIIGGLCCLVIGAINAYHLPR